MTKLTFDKSTIYKIQEIDLHDVEITNVLCDYNTHRIEIPIKLSSYTDAMLQVLLTFEGVHYVDISFYEPWGAGIYVNDININNGVDIIKRLSDYKDNDNCFCLSILLNSGDIINILAEKAIYSEV